MNNVKVLALSDVSFSPEGILTSPDSYYISLFPSGRYKANQTMKPDFSSTIKLTIFTLSNFDMQ